MAVEFRPAATAQRFARDPAGALHGDAVAGALILWLILVGIASVRRGGLPDQRGLVSLAVATLLVAAVAAVAPKPVTFVLMLLLVIAVAQNADNVANAIDALGANVRTALAR